MKNIIKENLQKKIIMKAWKIEDYIYIMKNLRHVNVFLMMIFIKNIIHFIRLDEMPIGEKFILIF